MSLKHNNLTAFVARSYFTLRTRGLEKLIFTATTGRSGTRTLVEVLSKVPGCVALHEPHPAMNDLVLKKASYGDSQYVDRVYRQVKSVNIRREAVGYRYYAEVNHLFIKTFALQAIDDFGNRLSVIHLVRPAIDVAMSIYQLQDQPGTEEGNSWWLDYRAPSNLIGIADLLDTHKEFSHAFYKALWYWFEVEARISDWKKRFPSVPFVRFETSWFNDKERIFELLEQLKIEFDKTAVEAVAGTRVNGREHDKRISRLNPNGAANMLRRFEDLLAERGFVLPSV